MKFNENISSFSPQETLLVKKELNELINKQPEPEVYELLDTKVITETTGQYTLDFQGKQYKDVLISIETEKSSGVKLGTSNITFRWWKNDASTISSTLNFSNCTQVKIHAFSQYGHMVTHVIASGSEYPTQPYNANIDYELYGWFDDSTVSSGVSMYSSNLFPAGVTIKVYGIEA